MPGPMKKRSSERTRRNTTDSSGVELKKGNAHPVTWPAADKTWEPELKKLYNSFKKSGMAAFMQQTDIQWLWLACSEYDEYRKSPRRSAMHLTAVLQMFKDGLGMTEGDRRKMHVELELPEPEVEDEVDRKRRELQESMRQKPSQQSGTN